RAGVSRGQRTRRRCRGTAVRPRTTSSARARRLRCVASSRFSPVPDVNIALRITVKTLVRHARLLLTVALTAAAVVSLRAQAPAPAQQPPVFRGGTTLVQVDAIVTDGSGTPVTDLA